ncbi:MAG: aminoacetone oxidase family FAD-binding enzyme [Ferrovum sp. 37-45-19]|uniref:NAD(P)/FAD-dependent oxidoreductase n=1 Tax=Ferrovum sp. JA12 TaxID=1356299 RepID=UPI000703A95D|nr:aminoacetone oxidase family FAD-binding enzyme [Ferrovum sp. JA12]OYV78997.1 MAG: aminoacetone oxidase family FAD-binding enzyme [Ferrovum sp. 21-44-67]OYV94370.1 MAG: aminoacetone oxidase family FAD-binding enzyme [Ferrovum sp. 37-45-19]HQT80630.1 aminoacetone oxidase family FAD-binding enzyme [Ferrovaceae bacterium]KRH79719.1 ferredoxin--NADP reductase [Ferrovum sp. JA12]HQU06735.1 aminoacetone oxidase family FAD-binding enzyme [Ferrovaceae bacterium]
MQGNDEIVWDAVVVGAGAAGLFCAGQAGLRHKRVLLLDHARKIGEKIRISGGGFCNFTNRYSSAQHFLSSNPHFVKSALSRYRPSDFEDWLTQAGIAYHEKHRGQLFCDHSAQDIIDLLLQQCLNHSVALRFPVSVENCQFIKDQWHIKTTQGSVKSHALVWATGGLPVPKIGASDRALRFAQQWGQEVVTPRPALVPLSLTDQSESSFTQLSGLSVPVSIAAGRPEEHYGVARFNEDLLFTHRGLSGPAVLQASSYWRENELLEVSFLEEHHWQEMMESAGGKWVENVLAQYLPQRLAKHLTSLCQLEQRRFAELTRTERSSLKELLLHMIFHPKATLGWNKAEVMLGGVNTHQMDSKTMASTVIPQCYFIGECVDVTGHLGGHNFQWAWSSAYACAQSLK